MDTTTVAQHTGRVRTAGIVGLVGGLVAVGVGAYELMTLPMEVSTTSGLRNALLHVAAIVGLSAWNAWYGRRGGARARAWAAEHLAVETDVATDEATDVATDGERPPVAS